MKRVEPGIYALAVGESGPGSSERKIGALLIDAGKLRPEDAEAVLALQREQGLRFGNAAVKLGLLTEADIQQVLSRQFNYPYLSRGEGGLAKELIAAYQPFSEPVERLRALRSQLMLRWFGAEHQHKCLAVVSADEREGRSWLAANLAVVFSQLGERTLLIDGDMRRPTQDKIFNLESAVGLSTMLSGRSDRQAVQRISGFVDLSVLPAGPIPPNPHELLGRAQFGTLVRELSAQFDVVLMDTPPAARSADAQMLASACGGAMLVTRKNKTHTRAARKVVAELTGTAIQMVGAVVNEF